MILLNDYTDLNKNPLNQTAGFRPNTASLG
jgi:hypothetical protein